MRPRVPRLLALLGLAGAAALVGSRLLHRREERVEHVELSFPDGATSSLATGSLEADHLLELGREVLRRAR